jgi:hypothetical protein
MLRNQLSFETFKDDLFLSLGDACAANPNGYEDAEAAAVSTGLEYDPSWVAQAVSVLEADGLVTTVSQLVGIPAMPTGKGWGLYHKIRDSSG